MRNKPTDKVEVGRLRFGDFRTRPGEQYGMFVVQGPCGRKLRIMVGTGTDEIPWEHVSVSIEGNRPPNWQEMCWVKEQFWTDEETVVQFHPRKTEYVNIHPNCLHLWKPYRGDVVLPPGIAV
jgi:hypothetical protein